MNDSEFSDQPEGHLFGKAFIIVLVVIFSGLSFTLGYFVGKGSSEKRSGNIVQVLDLPQSPQKQEPPTEQNVQTQQQTAVQPSDTRPSQQSEPIRAKDEKPDTAIEAEPGKATSKTDDKSKKASVISNSNADAPLFSVQIGAFKSNAEAERLKTKYEKKGYKIFITSAKNKKNRKIFKVKTGEFIDRKEAEGLALSINETDGIKTFVTLKDK